MAWHIVKDRFHCETAISMWMSMSMSMSMKMFVSLELIKETISNVQCYEAWLNFRKFPGKICTIRESNLDLFSSPTFVRGHNQHIS